MVKKKNTDAKSILKVQEKRRQVLSVNDLVSGILSSNQTALARAITLIESTQADHLKKANIILEKCLANKGDSIRIGITGVPGVGKSTFIEAFGKHLTSLGKKVAVLAIDPTSAQSKGSIMGDKTRMNELVKDPNAFVRPSPSSESLGGVARKTRETMILCEAAGYDVILVETVGVGQSETAVHSMVDFFLLLKLAGAGDELQGIKRGIIELADALVINKADGTNKKSAEAARIEFNRALHLFPPKKSGWVPQVLTCSALKKEGISEIWEMILGYIDMVKKSGLFADNRQRQNKSWLLHTIDDRLKQHFYTNPEVKEQLKKLLKDVYENKLSPFQAAEKLLRTYEKEKR